MAGGGGGGGSDGYGGSGGNYGMGKVTVWVGWRGRGIADVR